MHSCQPSKESDVGRMDTFDLRHGLTCLLDCFQNWWGESIRVGEFGNLRYPLLCVQNVTNDVDLYLLLSDSFFTKMFSPVSVLNVSDWLIAGISSR